jgi:tripartite-type tricarboxylate transporter receptor subunit TctC
VAERYDGFLAHRWQGLMAPRGTPEPILDQWHALAAAALTRPETQARLEALGLSVAASSPAEMAEAVAGETLRWQGVIRDAGITVG